MGRTITQSSVNIILALTFLLLLFIFQLQAFTLLFGLIFILLIIMAFLPEENRLFIWLMFAFFIGQIFAMYIDKLVTDILPTALSFFIGSILITIPMVFIIYVLKMFKKPLSLYGFTPEGRITTAFQNKRRLFIFLITVVSLLVLGLFIAPEKLGYLIIFSLLSAVLQEYFWRGLMLTRFVELTGVKIGLILSSISYGVFHYSFGFSPLICVAITFAGFFNGIITIKIRNILPATVIHIIIFYLLVVFDLFRIPI